MSPKKIQPLEERLAKNAEVFSVQPYSSLEACLGHPGLQAVVNGVETSMHAEVVETAAAAGLAIAEADRIVEAINRYQVPFTMAWQARCLTFFTAAARPSPARMKAVPRCGCCWPVISPAGRAGGYAG